MVLPQSGRKAASTVLLEFDFIPDIMILDKIDTPSGTPIDIEHHDPLPLLPLSETPFSDSIHPLVDHDDSVDTSLILIDTSPSDTLSDSMVEELPTVKIAETSTPEISVPELVEQPSAIDSETLEAIPENDAASVSSIANSTETTESTDIEETIETPETPETNYENPEVNTTEVPPVDITVNEIVETPDITQDYNQADYSTTEITETLVAETEIGEPETLDELDPLLDLAEEFPEEPEILSGVFTVGDNSVVAIDWLYDGGGYYKSQMGIFLLDDLDLESPNFINLALQHVTSNSELGYIVLNDATEGAKFASAENGGVYQELKTFNLRAGGNYGFVLIPNGSFEEALASLATGEISSLEIEPLFYLGTSNLNSHLSTGLIVDVTGDGNTFALEDLSFKGYNDLDINDIVFQVRGMTGIAVSMDELFDYEIIDLAKDWRTSDMGQALIEYVMPFVMDIERLPFLEIDEAPTTAQPLIGVIDTGFAQNNPYLDYDKITWGNDFIDNDTDPTWQAGESVTTGNEHGTHILGEIRELNQNVPIHAIRAVGSGQWAEALVDFVDTAKASNQPQGIVNLSMDLTRVNAEGSAYNRYELTPQERGAIAYAQEHNILLVVSAGNEGINEGQMTSTWGAAAQEFDNVLVVGAASPIPSIENGEGVETPEGTTTPTSTTASTWQRSDFSSSGVSLVAEGGTLENPELSTVGDGLGVMAGTSVATAKVTAAAAQVWATNPELSYRQVMEILQSTATDLQMLGWDQETGAGLLNLAAAVQLAKVMTPETVVNPKAPSFQPPPAPPLGSDPTTLTERPTNAGFFPSNSAFGLPSVVQVINSPLIRPVAQGLQAFGAAAVQTAIAVGTTVVSAVSTVPIGLGVGAAVAVGAIVWAGVAYTQLKQAEVEAAANTATNTWCQANLQLCHSGEAGTWNVYDTLSYVDGTTTGPMSTLGTFPDSNFAIVAVRPGHSWTFQRPPGGLTYSYGIRGQSVNVVFVPANGITSKTWAQLSEGAKQAVSASGALATAIAQAAQNSGNKGILAPGQDLSGGLIVSGGGFPGSVVNPASVYGYPKNTRWDYQPGIGWLGQIPGLAQVYFPNNIPEAKEKRNGPPTWREGSDGIGTWVFLSGKIIDLGEGYKVPEKDMHGIKKKILAEVGKGNFEKKVGGNPDIKVKNGKILLTGARNGPFKNKSLQTDVEASKHLNK